MLLTLPDGSHRNVPDPESIAQDVDSLISPRELGRSDQLVQSTGFTEVDLGGGLSFFRAHLGEGRGVFRQRGYLEEHLKDFSDGFVIYDDYEIAHNGFVTEFQQSVLPGPTPATWRLPSAYFAGQDVLMPGDFGQDKLYRTGTVDIPVLSLVAGYTRPGVASYANCMKSIQVAGAPTLWIGLDAALQVLTDLNNPPTSTTINLGGNIGCFGLVQTPIDGDAVQIYTYDSGGGIIRRLNTNVALASGVLENGKRLPPNGYTVGMVNLDGNTDVFYVVPSDGFAFVAAGSVGGSYTPPSWRGKLLRTDLRAQYGPQEVTVQTPFVGYCTAGANSLFYCDFTSHRYMTHGADIPVDRASDRPRYSGGDYRRYCVGHHRVDDRFFWTENEVDAQGGVTYWRRFEFDTKTRRSWPVSQRIPYARSGVQAMGSPSLPVLVTSGHLVDSHLDAWTFQYQPRTGTLGYSLTHVDGAGTASGKRFNPAATRYSPVLRSKKHPMGRLVICQVIAPPLADIRTGTGSEADLVPSEAFCRITFSDQTTFEVHANELGDHRTALAYPDSDSWVSEFFFATQSSRGTTGANAARYTPNGAIWTIMGYIYEPSAVKPSANYKDWGAEEAAPSNMVDILA